MTSFYDLITTSLPTFLQIITHITKSSSVKKIMRAFYHSKNLEERSNLSLHLKTVLARDLTSKSMIYSIHHFPQQNHFRNGLEFVRW